MDATTPSPSATRQPTAHVTRSRRSAAPRRVLAIGRAEFTLFWRNPTALLTALLMPIGMVVLLGPTLGNSLIGGRFTVFMVNTLALWSLLFVVYFTLTTVLVSRREEGMLQRMSTGEATSWEAVIGASLPTSVIAVVQILLGGIAASVAFAMPSVVNPLLPIVGILACLVVLIGLAAWTSSITSTVEGAQYSTMPLFMVLVFFSGTIPLSLLPDAVGRIAEATPMYAMSDLISIGLIGVGGAGDSTPVGFLGSWAVAGRSLIVLGVWAALAVWIARSRMRFTRRR